VYVKLATNPPNPNIRNKGKANWNHQPQGNQGNQGTQPNSPKADQPNPLIQQQGKQSKQNKAIRTNKSYACCQLFGHYTHECPLLPQMHHAWEVQVAASRGP